MNNARQRLDEIVEAIADSARPLDSFGVELMDYGLLLRRLLHESHSGFSQPEKAQGHSLLDSGEALSPWHAAAVTEDQTRTAAFIRGSIRAVQLRLTTDAQRPLHLLEAGCGPLGTLVVPLLTRFGPEKLDVSVIDLHQESIDGTRQVLKALGLSNRIRHAVCGDIRDVRLETQVDIALSETMNSALSREPQASIARALVRQYPEAILLPQSVRVHLTLLNAQAELSMFPPQALERIEVGLVFELTAQSALQLTESNGRLPAARLRVPSEVAPGYFPYLTTTVEVFDGVRISDYQTAITVPAPVESPVAIQPGDELQFAYRLGDSPGMECAVVEA